MFGMVGAFNPAFYAKVARQPVGRSIGFLAVFVLIISGVLSVKYTVSFFKVLDVARGWADKDFIPLAQEFPAIEIKDGAVVSPTETYKKEFGKNFCFAIEPDGHKVQPLLDGYDNVILLARQQVIVKSRKSAGATEQKAYDLAQVRLCKVQPTASGLSFVWEQNAVEVTPALIKQWIAAVSAFAFPVILLFVFGIYSFTKPLQALVFSLAALIINSAYKASLRYAQLFSVSVYAMVPSTSAAVLLELSGIRLGFFWFLYTAVYILFLILGVQAAAGEPSPEKDRAA